MTLRLLLREMERRGLSRTEIRALVGYRLGVAAEALPLRIDDDFDAREILSDCGKAAKGEPVEYIVGAVDFFGAHIKVTRDTLIPRVETELLCDEAAKAAEGAGASRIADICTGSGCIAVSLAKKLRIKADAFDVSEKALAVARENAEANGVADLVGFYKSDVLSGDFSLPAEYDIIVSNPPYVSGADMELLPESVKREPEIALFGGEDGLDFYRALTITCPEHIRRGGALFFEIGDGQGSGVAEIAKSRGLSAEVMHDYSGRERIVRIDI